MEKEKMIKEEKEHEHEGGCACHGHHHHHGGDCNCGHEHGVDYISNKLLIISGIFAFIGVFVHIFPVTQWFPILEEFCLPGMKIPLFEIIVHGSLFVAYVICGKSIIIKAIKGLLEGNFLNENFLMSVSSIGALILGEVSEATVIMVLFQVGMKFENLAIHKSRNAIGEISKLRPDYARVILENADDNENIKTEKIIPDNVEIGTLILVKPGERIPIDGIIEKGESYLDTSALNGESIPVYSTVGDSVLSGAINKQGILKIKTTKLAKDSALSRILNLVENATENKTKAEQFVTRFAKVYTPIVCGAALILAIVPSLYTKFFMPEVFKEYEWREWIQRSLEFLVVSCPCALVISIPLSFCAGITNCAKKGVLVKGSTFMEALAKVKIAVFDKTGTLTKGNFIVTDIHTMDEAISQQELIAIATHAELLSSHPISTSLRAAHHDHCCDEVKLENVEEITSEGIRAVVNGKNVLAGNSKLMKHFGISYPDCSEHKDGTIIHVACQGKYSGHIVINDEIKEEAAETVKALKKLGVQDIVMLTGDGERVSKSVAEKIGIDTVYSQMMSADKLEKVKELLGKLSTKGKESKKRKSSLIFVGDGINDAPVLALADAGIAMGAMGTDAAVEAGDIVIMEDNPLKIVEGIKISRKSMNVVYQNIIASVGIKGIILILSAFGITGMWLAVFGDVGVTILAVLNSLRLLKTKK